VPKESRPIWVEDIEAGDPRSPEAFNSRQEPLFASLDPDGGSISSTASYTGAFSGNHSLGATKITVTPTPTTALPPAGTLKLLGAHYYGYSSIEGAVFTLVKPLRTPYSDEDSVVYETIQGINDGMLVDGALIDTDITNTAALLANPNKQTITGDVNFGKALSLGPMYRLDPRTRAPDVSQGNIFMVENSNKYGITTTSIINFLGGEEGKLIHVRRGYLDRFSKIYHDYDGDGTGDDGPILLKNGSASAREYPLSIFHFTSFVYCSDSIWREVGSF